MSGVNASRRSEPAGDSVVDARSGNVAVNRRGIARPLVYIAGPYTRDDPVLNTREAVKWGEKIETYECDVVIPHLSLLWHAISPAPLERWYERDLAVLARCDALVRFPGESTGADAEMAYAGERKIPRFVSHDGAIPAGFASWRWEVWPS